MEDDRKLPRNSSPAGSDESGDVTNQIDDLLPVPSSEGDHYPGQVDGPIDTLLPAPGPPSNAADDITTREELGVDTTADDIDDFIDSEPHEVSATEAIPPEDILEISGEPVRWEPVEDQPRVSDPAADDHEPINHDSDFFTTSYSGPAHGEQHSHRADATDGQPVLATTTGHQCPACGELIGLSPFCPQCGTDQHPQSRLATLFSPLLAWSRPAIIRAVLTVAMVLALIALLANSGATALIISAATIPVVLVIRMAMHLRMHATSGWVQIAMMAFVGLVAGLPLAWFGARMVRRSWIETGVLNFGAAGFGGAFAEVAGTAPFVVWLVVGLLLPIVIILGIGAIPAALRMVLNAPPRETTGMMLSGALAAGYVVASGIIFFRPLYTELAPQMTTSQWTLTIFGLAVIRPLVWVFSGAMIGAMVWRYLRTASLATIMVPAAIAISLPLGFSLVSVAASPGGYWLETLLGIGFAIAVVFFYQRFLVAAVKNDATLAGATSTEP